MEEVKGGHFSTDFTFRDYCDGSYIQNHPMFKDNPEMLQLSFYFDELEVANPLGSKRGKHKLGNVNMPGTSSLIFYFWSV